MALKGGREEPSLKKDFFFSPRMNLLQINKENNSDKSIFFCEFDTIWWKKEKKMIVFGVGLMGF